VKALLIGKETDVEWVEVSVVVVVEEEGWAEEDVSTMTPILKSATKSKKKA
jgi:hypothetical protein